MFTHEDTEAISWLSVLLSLSFKMLRLFLVSVLCNVRSHLYEFTFLGPYPSWVKFDEFTPPPNRYISQKQVCLGFFYG